MTDIVRHTYSDDDPKLDWAAPVDFPARNQPIDERLWALAQLLRRIPGELSVAGVVINASLITDLEDAAALLAKQRVDRQHKATTAARNAATSSRLRWNYG